LIFSHHFLSVRHQTQGDLERILERARGLEKQARTGADKSINSILATLFYEPSTRTRLSFETAMHRLGGRIIGFADARTSSVAKGESLADTFRMLSHYADIAVIRHPREGSARAAAAYSTIPVINGGDGGHEHPTQTMLDLYTILSERGRIEGLNVILCGDLLYGRTAHSLAWALMLLGANIICVSPHGLEMPTHVMHLLHERFGRFPAVEYDLEQAIADADVLYVTRIQKERFLSEDEYFAAKGIYTVDAELMQHARANLIVMHPLPRVDEITVEVDQDPRAAYFRQAFYGIPVRMALLDMLLKGEIKLPTEVGYIIREERCPNEVCVSRSELYLPPEFEPLTEKPNTFRCIYCDHEVEDKREEWEVVEEKA
jgi:aspartate carbamoyltransferase catalytic subunit